MNQAPKTFITICSMADIPLEEAQEKWLEIWEKTIRDFLVWLLKEVDLTPKQLQETEKIFNDVKSQKIKNRHILDLIIPILESDQQALAIEKFSEIFVDHLDNFYTDLKAKLNLEQKQVLKAYLST